MGAESKINMAAPTEEHGIGKCDILCEIEATAPTGFEELACGEVKEKLGVDGVVARGKVNFCLPKERAKECLQLRGADNLVVVLKHYHDYKFADTLEGCIKQFEDMVTDIDWDLGLEVWQMYSGYPHAIDPKPKTTEEIKKLGLRADAAMNLAERQNASCEEGAVELTKDTPAKRLHSAHPTIPGFRATCYRSAAKDGETEGKHLFQSPQAACAFGGAINDHFGWIVDLKNYDIEVVLTVEGNHVYVALALTKESLHRRNIAYFGSTVLRPTIAYNMLRFCNIQPGDVVIDPMCGSGSIPIEAALNWTKSFHIGGEIHEQSVKRTQLNIDALNIKRNTKNRSTAEIDVINWDVTKLPLRNESVDVFITDLPFGKRSGNKVRNWVLYPRLLVEMARVARPGSGRAVLLTMDKKCLRKTLGELKSLWKHKGELNWVNIGGLNAIVLLLHRSFNKVSDEIWKSVQPSEKAQSKKTDSKPKDSIKTHKPADGDKSD